MSNTESRTVPRSVLPVVLVSGLVWTAQDQLQRIDWIEPIASLSAGAAVLLLFAGWVAWRARGSWWAAGLGTAALTLGMQSGRFFSDFISGIDWSASDYWQFWGSGWPVLLAINGTLILILLLPIRLLQSRWRDA